MICLFANGVLFKALQFSRNISYVYISRKLISPGIHLSICNTILCHTSGLQQQFPCNLWTVYAGIRCFSSILLLLFSSFDVAQFRQNCTTRVCRLFWELNKVVRKTSFYVRNQFELNEQINTQSYDTFYWFHLKFEFPKHGVEHDVKQFIDSRLCLYLYKKWEEYRMTYVNGDRHIYILCVF